VIDHSHRLGATKFLRRYRTTADTSAWIDDKVMAPLCHASQFSDSSVFERSVRLTAAATGQIAGFDRAEGFLPAPGYPPRTPAILAFHDRERAGDSRAVLRDY
jgi:hypothetical protein